MPSWSVGIVEEGCQNPNSCLSLELVSQGWITVTCRWMHQLSSAASKEHLMNSSQHFFVGIDVAKAQLYVTITATEAQHSSAQVVERLQCSNDTAGLQRLVE